jgi:hypothetical protein
MLQKHLKEDHQQLVDDLFTNVFANLDITTNCIDKVRTCSTSKSTLRDCQLGMHSWNDLGKQREMSFDDYKKYCRLANQCKSNVLQYFEKKIQRHENKNNKYNGNTARRLINMILTHGTIAGGFLLKFCGNQYVQSRNGTLEPFDSSRIDELVKHLRCDIDIYMTRSEFAAFAEYLDEHHKKKVRKNMRFIYSGLAGEQNIHFHVQTEIMKFKFDFVIVDDIDTCITNFDLTVCMLGLKFRPDYHTKQNEVNQFKNVYFAKNRDITLIPKRFFDVEMAYPDHIYSKSAEMTPSFVTEYLNGNNTTRNRVNKYMRRKYHIRIPYQTQHCQTTDDAHIITLQYSNYHTFQMNRQNCARGIKLLRVAMAHLTREPYGAPYLMSWTFIAEYEETFDFYNRLKSRWTQFHNGNVDLFIPEYFYPINDINSEAEFLQLGNAYIVDDFDGEDAEEEDIEEGI